MWNATVTSQDGDPRLPEFHLAPKPPLVPFLSDQILFVIAPVVLYWGYGILFFVIDHMDYMPQYRLHTPEEFLKRNRVPMLQVIGYVLFYQFLTVLLSLYLIGEDDLYGSEAYDITQWAIRYQDWGRSFSTAFLTMTKSIEQLLVQPLSAITIMPRLSRWLGQNVQEGSHGLNYPPLTSFHIQLANITYYYIVPMYQFFVAIAFADTWQYFYHRTVHLNRWLYVNLHASHHRVYVPYAFGTFYSNLIEAFLVDVISTTLSLYLSGFTTRQAMCFVNLSVLKAVDDHSGYAIPWNPFQWFTPQTALYHDIHHQSWGIKTNFAQVYTTFWDHVMGTVWQGDDINKHYERGDEVAEEWDKISGLQSQSKIKKLKANPIAKSKVNDNNNNNDGGDDDNDNDYSASNEYQSQLVVDDNDVEILSSKKTQ